MKVHIGLVPQVSSFCSVVCNVIYVYVGLGTAFMILVAVCVARGGYTSRKFLEQDALLMMHMPCYNEPGSVMRRIIDSYIEFSYEKRHKLLFIITDGIATAAGGKLTESC